MVHRRLYPTLSALAIAVSILACSLGSPSAPGTSPTSPAGPAATTAPTTSAGSDSTPDACKNAYYPVVQGAAWDYSMTGAVASQFRRTITVVKSDGFTEQSTFTSGTTLSSEWKCDDGALTDLQPDAAGSASVETTSGLTANFHTTDFSGTTVPDNIGPGATWNEALTLEGTENISGQDVKAKNVITMDCTGASTESVTVPAGKFDALRADCKVDQKVTITMNGAEIPTDVASTATMWYASGVGMVKTEEVISGSAPVTIELTSYKIP